MLLIESNIKETMNKNLFFNFFVVYIAKYGFHLHNEEPSNYGQWM
jgi:hypothetical protein